MSIRTTPLGFLPGDIDLRSHCMFIYPERDENFVRSIVGYLSAGMNAGELCICAVNGGVREQIKERMVQLGADPVSEPESGQLCVLDAADVYTPHGIMDAAFTMRFWQNSTEIAGRKWKGLRVFGDSSPTLQGSVSRLKLLEYEALVNVNFPMSIALCGYRSSTLTRSFLLQAKSVHPFIANRRSIRRNNSFVETRRFLNGLYRFRRATRQYAAVPRQARVVREDLEEIAARTPLTMLQIEEMKVAVTEAFANAVEHGCHGLESDSAHVHVVFMPQPDRFTVTVRDHGPGFEFVHSDLPDSDQVRQRGLYLIRCLTDDVQVERRNGDTIVTVVKKYSSSC